MNTAFYSSILWLCNSLSRISACEGHCSGTSWCSVCDDFFHSGEDHKYMDPEIEAQAGDEWLVKMLSIQKTSSFWDFWENVLILRKSDFFRFFRKSLNFEVSEENSEFWGKVRIWRKSQHFEKKSEFGGKVRILIFLEKVLFLRKRVRIWDFDKKSHNLRFWETNRKFEIFRKKFLPTGITEEKS